MMASGRETADRGLEPHSTKDPAMIATAANRRDQGSLMNRSSEDMLVGLWAAEGAGPEEGNASFTLELRADRTGAITPAPNQDSIAINWRATAGTLKLLGNDAGKPWLLRYSLSIARRRGQVCETRLMLTDEQWPFSIKRLRLLHP